MVSRAHIGGHNDDGVLKVGDPPSVVGQAAVVEHLQQDVEGVGVGLFDLVEQYDGVGALPHGLGQLAALVVPYVARRGPHEPTYGVPFLVLTHVDAGDGALVVEEHLRQGLGQLGLTHPGRAQEDEAADGPVLVLQPRPTATYGIGDGPHGFPPAR